MRGLVFVVLFFVNFYAVSQSLSAKIPQAVNGTLDARSWKPNENKIALNGYWKFYRNEFVSPDSLLKPTVALYFPEVWTPATQYGTYHLLVWLSNDSSKLALEVPQIYCSYELWANGKKIGVNGKVGTSKESSIPQWLPQVIAFDHPGDSLSIVLHISNFYHFKGGSREPVYLGTANMLNNHHSVSKNSILFESIGLVLISLIFFIIYYLREERKKITLYFSLLCLSWAIRSEFSNLYVFISYFPNFDWNTMVRIEYITLFLTMIWTILFLSRLFPNESSKTIKYVLVTANCSFIAMTIVASPAIFTRWLDIYLIAAAILLVFCSVLVIRAWINERSGARYVVICIFLSIALFSYDLVIYEGFFHHYNAVLFSTGYLVMFMMMGVSLLYHLQIFKGDVSSSTLTFEELYGKSK